MKHTHTATIYVSRNGIDDIAVSITGTVSPARRGTRTNKWDRFAEPDEPAECEITESVVVGNVWKDGWGGISYRVFADGDDIDLTEAEQERAEEALFEAANDRAELDKESLREGMEAMDRED